MHETSIAIELRRLCERESAGRVARRVRIAVGELSSVAPALLELAWREVAADGDRPAPALEIEYRPAIQTCPTCGVIAERQPGSWMRLCPTCGAALRVEGGDELDLLGVELADDVP
jgi:Zn finger protein HypA/HybF involved in hydrogenase expression